MTLFLIQSPSRLPLLFTGGQSSEAIRERGSLWRV
ncbi:hypothetical protein DESA109040_09015 [Deinococcus saxicola]